MGEALGTHDGHIVGRAMGSDAPIVVPSPITTRDHEIPRYQSVRREISRAHFSVIDDPLSASLDIFTLGQALQRGGLRGNPGGPGDDLTDDSVTDIGPLVLQIDIAVGREVRPPSTDGRRPLNQRDILVEISSMSTHL